MRHQWDPTDSQGYDMQCTACGATVSAWRVPQDWDQVVDAECPELPKGVVLHRPVFVVDLFYSAPVYGKLHQGQRTFAYASSLTEARSLLPSVPAYGARGSRPLVRVTTAVMGRDSEYGGLDLSDFEWWFEWNREAFCYDFTDSRRPKPPAAKSAATETPAESGDDLPF